LAGDLSADRRWNEKRSWENLRKPLKKLRPRPRAKGVRKDWEAGDKEAWKNTTFSIGHKERPKPKKKKKKEVRERFKRCRRQFQVAAAPYPEGRVNTRASQSASPRRQTRERPI